MRILGRSALAIAALTAACHSGRKETVPAPVQAPVAAATPTRYTNGEQVLAAMHAKYEGKWYTTLTFIQKTSRLLPTGKWDVQTWYEASHIPGRLRIDFDPISAGNGVIYARDSAFTIRNGRALPGTASTNELLVLGFDVYGQPASRTAAVLQKEGFDLSRVHRSTFEGRPMIVVGAHESDLRRKQFWIDAERMYFVRIVEPSPRDTSKMQDIRFANYRREGDAWVSPRVEIHADGKLVFFEEYSDIKTNLALDEALFDPTKWKTAKHWMQ